MIKEEATNNKKRFVEIINSKKKPSFLIRLLLLILLIISIFLGVFGLFLLQFPFIILFAFLSYKIYLRSKSTLDRLYIKEDSIILIDKNKNEVLNKNKNEIDCEFLNKNIIKITSDKKKYFFDLGKDSDIFKAEINYDLDSKTKKKIITFSDIFDLLYQFI